MGHHFEEPEQMTTEDRIRDALNQISPDEYDNWLKVGMALKKHDGESLKGLWKSWSAQSGRYVDRDAESTWRAFPNGGKVGLGTLFFLAGQIRTERSPLKFAAGFSRLPREMAQWGRRYLENRGLDPNDLVRYGWRSCPSPSWKWEDVVRWMRKSDVEVRKAMCRGKVLFVPIFNQQGQMVNVRIRKVQEGYGPKVVQLPGTSPLHPYRMDDPVEFSEVLHICEGEIDAESLRVHVPGDSVWGLPGTSIWKDEWNLRVAQVRPRVILWMDGDMAGRLASRKISDRLTYSGVRCRRVTLPKGKDVNDLLLEGKLATWVNQTRTK